MGSRGRNYIHGDTEYRGRVIETGWRMTTEYVYDETEEEYQARRAAWLADNPGRSYYGSMPDPYRKYHAENRGLQPYTDDRTYGPYATIGPARAAAGTGRGVSQRIEEGDNRGGGTFRRDRRVEIGTVTWRVLDADGEPVAE